MKVKLAGFNVDIENINLLNKYLSKKDTDSLTQLQNLNWTPETISASYARISRDERPIDQLREEARREIVKSRKSNQNIIFEMGHSSIAEHAVFNIDMINISRLLSEEIEKSRLASFTEKSQRYIKIGEDNYYPSQFKENSNFFNEYQKLIDSLFESYNYIHDKLLRFFENKYNIKKGDKAYRDTINLAKEDARYILPLSCFTQLGMTINSRGLEKLLKKLFSANIPEFTELADNILKSIEGYAPSLIKYTKPTPYDIETYTNIKEIINTDNEIKAISDVELVSFDKEIVNKIVSALILKSTDTDYKTAFLSAKKMTTKEKELIIFNSFNLITKHDSLLREFEMSNFEFGISLSATCYAQLKRHRMATIIDGEYSPRLGNIIPKSIIDIGEKDFFIDKINSVNNLFNKAKNNWGKSADYILTNSHKKNIILKCNFRELTHISRLRSDIHAQWEIRMISDKIIDSVSKELPFLSQLLCGKDTFDEKFNKIKTFS